MITSRTLGMNTQCMLIALAGAIAPMAAHALDVSLSGQVNRAIRFADNGAGSDVQYVDGSVWKSRFRLATKGEVMPGITAGAHIEAGRASSDGGGLDVENADFGPEHDDFRHSYPYFSGDVGKITLGNAPAADNGVMWTSHNGAWMGTEYSPDTNSGPGVMMTDGATDQGCETNGECPKPTPRPPCCWPCPSSLDPNVIGGMILMDDVLGFAGGIAFANSTSVNAAWGSDDASGQDYEDMYIDVAHPWGNMAVAIDYRSTENDDDMEGRAIGLGAQIALVEGVDVYAGFNNYSFDAAGMDLEVIATLNSVSSSRFSL